jgi:tRNA A-37 threonylcarbamoyl transferase component Bud32
VAQKASQTNKDAMYKKIGTLLDKLHQVGIVHNDLHQGNIMIGRMRPDDHRL